MNIKKTIFLLLSNLMLFLCNAQKGKAFDKLKPKLIYVLADNYVHRDVSNYGQEKFSTPNINKLIVHQPLYILKIGIPFRQNHFNLTFKKL